MNALYSSLISDFETRLTDAGIPQRLGLGAGVAPERVAWTLASRAGVEVDVLPLDRLHPVISGNKWFKLKYNLLAAREAGAARVVSCGGARSNHLHALAWAGQRLGLPVRAFVRGEEWASADNSTLRDLEAWEADVRFVSRQQYRAWRECGWRAMGDACDYVIPEGGDNFLGVLGCVSLAAMIDAERYSAVHVAGGTGCTFTGIRVGLPARVAVVGHSMLKGTWQQAQMRSRLQLWRFGCAYGNWQWLPSENRFGHSASTLHGSHALQDFMSAFEEETRVRLDPVYTGPLFLRLSQWMQVGEIVSGARLLVVHSGGLQGA